MAHRVISLPRSNWVAFGAKRTRPKSAATKTVQITGQQATRGSQVAFAGKSVLNRFRRNLGADHGPVPGEGFKSLGSLGSVTAPGVSSQNLENTDKKPNAQKM